MAVTTKLLDRLAALDLTGPQYQEVLSILAETEKAEEERRAKVAERTRRYRKRGGGDIADDLRKQAMERDGFKCVYCGSVESLQLDHVIPVSRGGPTTLENLATACRFCNAKKRDRDRKYVQRHSNDRPTNVHGLNSDTPPKKVSPITPSKNNPPSVANATAQPVRDVVWTEGVRKLIAMGGMLERAARSNVGRWLKVNPAGKVLDAIEAAEKAGSRDPIPYVTEALKPKVLPFAKDWDAGAKRQIEAREDTRKETPEERSAHVERRLGKRLA